MHSEFQHTVLPGYSNTVKCLRDEHANFSHYTSAEAAVSILEKKEIWFRSASVMNDFNEIQHGSQCVARALSEPSLADGFFDVLRELNALDSARRRFVYSPQPKNNTYLACLSEHSRKSGAPSESELGRLSMWRAYGGNTNVALVLKREQVLGTLNNFLMLQPVIYASQIGFNVWFREFVDLAKKNINYLKSEPSKAYFALTDVLHAAALATKHPGFAEEREWRLIHRPGHGGHDLTCKVFSVGGVPQKVYLLKLDNKNGLPDLNDVLDHILVGPTQFPDAISDALVQVMKSSGYSDPERRVKVSEIPLRR